MTDEAEKGALVEFPSTGADTIQTVGELADRLRQLRRRHARQRGDSPLTYRELAVRTGWAHGVIGDYFTGKSLPTTDRFDVLISLLGATRSEVAALANARDRVEEYRRDNAAQSRSKFTRPDLSNSLPAFTGRAAQLAELDADSPIVVISGPAGVGKSALVTYWSARESARFPDGSVHVDLRRSPVPAELAAHYRDLIADRRLLVVLDNATDAGQIRPLLPDVLTGRVIVIGRHPVVGLPARRIDVGPLPPHESLALLTALIGPRAAENPAAVLSLAATSGGLPLALHIAAEHVLAHPVTPLTTLADDWSALAAGWPRLTVPNQRRPT